MTAIEACPFRVVLAPPAGPVLEVRVTRPADLDWLQENLIPWFEPAAGRMPEKVVSVRVSRDEHDRLIAVCGQGTRPATTFAFHGQPDPTRVLLGEPAVVWDEDLRVFVRESPESPHFEVVAAREQEATRVALMRILRETATDGLVAQQALPLHAAAVDRNGAGVLVAGPRRAGKTTCLLHLLHDPAARFVANDRVFAQSQAGESLVLTGMPTIIGIRPESRELAGQGRFDQSLGWRARRTVQEVHTLPPETNPEESGGKLAVSPAQLLHCLGRQAVARTDVKRILFPLTDPTRAGIEVRVLDPDEVTRRLAANLFPLNGSTGHGLLSEQLSDQQASILRMLARVPARELVLGHRAVPSPELFGSWLDDIK